jgi:hypothetical protein
MISTSVLSLPAQIFLMIWMHEMDVIKASVFIAGVFAMLPLLYFLLHIKRFMMHGIKDRRQGSGDKPHVVTGTMVIPLASYLSSISTTPNRIQRICP